MEDSKGKAGVVALTKTELDAKRELARKHRALIQGLRWFLSQHKESIPGMTYLEDFVTRKEEEDLLKTIYEQAWDTSMSRRVQHYGYRYNYKGRGVRSADWLGELPGWADFIIKRGIQIGIFPHDPEFNQMIINEYLPGQGISPHIDQPRTFGRRIVSLSLGTMVPMEFTREEWNEEHTQWLRARSIVVLTKDSRYHWKHSIPARKTDKDKRNLMITYHRARRVSITFRKVVECS